MAQRRRRLAPRAVAGAVSHEADAAHKRALLPLLAPLGLGAAAGAGAAAVQAVACGGQRQRPRRGSVLLRMQEPAGSGEHRGSGEAAAGSSGPRHGPRLTSGAAIGSRRVVLIAAALWSPKLPLSLPLLLPRLLLLRLLLRRRRRQRQRLSWRQLARQLARVLRLCPLHLIALILRLAVRLLAHLQGGGGQPGSSGYQLKVPAASSRQQGSSSSR